MRRSRREIVLLAIVAVTLLAATTWITIVNVGECMDAGFTFRYCLMLWIR